MRATAARALLAAAALLALPPRAAPAPDPAPGSPVPFVMSARYGRSPDADRHLEPRADRFFMGSRYGKRSQAAAWEGEGVGEGEEEEEEEGALVCEYTGVMALYQCYYRTHRQPTRPERKMRV